MVAYYRLQKMRARRLQFEINYAKQSGVRLSAQPGGPGARLPAAEGAAEDALTYSSVGTFTGVASVA